MIKYLYRIIIAVLCIAVLTGCEQSKPCIDADDFGFPKIALNAQGIDVEQSGADSKGIPIQVSKWKDSELVIDGSQIIFDVYGRWFPWLLGDPAIVRDPCRYDTNISNPYSLINTGTVDYSGIRVKQFAQPCWLTKGVGVYGLTMKTDASGDANLSPDWQFTANADPNRSIASRRFPSEGNTFHMGNPNTSDLFPTRTFDFDSDPGGGAFMSGSSQGIRLGTYNQLGRVNETQIGDRLYFKLIDTFYDDNGGSVVVKIRSGARSPYPGVFERMINAVNDILLGSAESIFRQLLDPSRSDIPRAIRAMLVLYVAIYGLYYVMGMVSPNTTQAVFLTKIIKFGVVIALLGPGSYEFFYDHLLVLFTDGMRQMINIVSGPFLTGSAHATDRLTFFDDVFKKLFSEETNIKIASLLWYPNPTNKWIGELNVKGIIFIPVLYIFIAFFAVALLKALLVYLMALIALGLLIAIAPIIIPFILFSKTKELYDGWIKTLVGTLVQPVLLFGFLTLMYVILMESLYKTLGYRVCWNTWWSGSLFGEGSFLDIVDAHSSKNSLKAWMPNIRDKWEAILIPPFFYSAVSVPGCDIGSGTTSNVGDVFLDIDCSTVGEHCRMVDYPALVPADGARCNPVTTDVAAKNDELQIARATTGTVTSFEDIFFFGVTIFLMFLFSDKVPQLARDIAGIARGAALESAAGGLWGNMKSIGSNPLGVKSIGKAAFTRARKAAGIGSLDKGFRSWQDKVGGAYDKHLKDGKFIKRGAMRATGTYGAYKKLGEYQQAGNKALFDPIHKAQDAVGGKLDKVDKAFGKMDPRNMAAKGFEKAAKKLGEGVGTVGGKLAYGTPEKSEKPRSSLIGGGTSKERAEWENHAKNLQKESDSLQKKSDELQKRIDALDPNKDKTAIEKLAEQRENLEKERAEVEKERAEANQKLELSEKIAKERTELEDQAKSLEKQLAKAKDDEERAKLELQLKETQERLKESEVTTKAELESQAKALQLQTEELQKQIAKAKDDEERVKLELQLKQTSEQFEAANERVKSIVSSVNKDLLSESVSVSQQQHSVKLDTSPSSGQLQKDNDNPFAELPEEGIKQRPKDELTGSGMFTKGDGQEKARFEKARAEKAQKKQEVDAEIRNVETQIKSLNPATDQSRIDELKGRLKSLKNESGNLN